ncbi:MAG: chromosome segregation protein SMC [Clostridiales bacterium]|nr:chromosome segregation protein SMC [Eubacteriales bacterium]MDH7565090.1 chromosome segregation protein SMC [Clostridiales bacterium]
MYLKRLEIQGFKSFAEKLSLDFNPGITSIVGPNGSGKSNIADAVRWVLGEQSVKTLRGSKMEDVIFAGTEYRKPMGFAEVSLTIDNTDSTLPVAFSEVTVTRRVYRSGESEYFINKMSCRLKDINELFLDTGIGKDGYSIIGQGRVDEILSSKSEDRRNIFEEASGIMKYKLRKLEAEKKLEMTRQNLLRINDIIGELENQLEPLRQQSETAKRFLALRDELKELEINVYLDSISKIREKLKEFEAQYATIKDNIENENTRLKNITSENEKKSRLLKMLEEKIQTSRSEYYNLEGGLERCKAEIRLNEEKISNLSQNISRIENEILEIQRKVDGMVKEEEAKVKKAEYLKKQYDDYSVKLIEQEKQMENILSTLDENERHIENLKAGIMDKLDVLSDKKTQINNIKVHIENLRKRQKNVEREAYQAALDKDKQGMKQEDLVESLRKTRERIHRSESKISGLNKQKEDFDARLADLSKKQNNLKSDLQFKRSRLKILQDMERNLEGYNKSVRSILQSCHSSAELAKGIHGAVAQIIKVEKKFETAIEMTLGSALQNIVTTSEEDAKRAVDFLKLNKLGRATFLPISSVKGKYFDAATLEELKKQEGFCGVASDLVSCSQEYRGIVLSLLGRVAVVNDLDAGIRISRKFGYSFRITTLEGDIISTVGSIAGGSSDSRGTGILSRNREILELESFVERLENEEKKSQQDIQEAMSSLNEIVKEIALEEEALKADTLVLVRDESQLAQVEESISRAEARMEMLKQEKEQLIKQEKSTEIELEKYHKELAEVESDISTTKAVIAEYQEKHKGDQLVRDALHRDITDFKISVNSILESMESVKEALEKVREERESLLKGISKRNHEKNRSCEDIKSYREKNKGLLKTVRGYEEEKSGKTFEIDRLSEEKKVVEEELSEIVNKINDVNKNILLLQEEFNRVEVRKAKIESEMEAIQNRMWDEYEMTYTNALALKKDIGSIAQAQKRIADLKNRIKELGPVNVSSIEEYIKTKERHEFMRFQRDDMENAKEKLRKVISEMTSLMKKQFLEQFKRINDNFNTVFKELFEGGRAELKLTDMENVLECGIEIEAQPPGKKLQNMMLLSGGERALTAIALLFSILRLRPAPFCILDEIEAALDDANVYRFAQYIRKYSQETQFIMVTHRKGTMEMSDTLYGVTMQERGVSKIVSVKIGEKAS